MRVTYRHIEVSRGAWCSGGGEGEGITEDENPVKKQQSVDLLASEHK